MSRRPVVISAYSLFTLFASQALAAEPPMPTDAELLAQVADIRDPAGAPGAPEPPEPPTPILRTVGAAVFAVGYLPVAVPALPSTIGLVGRAALFGLTAGLGYWFPCGYPAIDPPPDMSSSEEAAYRRRHTPDYLCRGDHGAVQLLVPIAGPILFARNDPADSVLNPGGPSLSPGMKGLLYASAAVQTVGVGLLIASALIPGPSPTKASASATSSKALTLSVSPDFSPVHVGARLELAGW